MTLILITRINIKVNRTETYRNANYNEKRKARANTSSSFLYEVYYSSFLETDDETDESESSNSC